MSLLLQNEGYFCVGIDSLAVGASRTDFVHLFLITFPASFFNAGFRIFTVSSGAPLNDG